MAIHTLACYGTPNSAPGVYCVSSRHHLAHAPFVPAFTQHVLAPHKVLVTCSAWDDPEFVEAVLRLVLSRLVDSQLGIFAMLNFAISMYAVGALTTKVAQLFASCFKFAVGHCGSWQQ